MVKFLKRAIVPLVLACMIFVSVGCDDKKNNNGNGGNNPPADSYSITSAEAQNILDSLETKMNTFVYDLNKSNVLQSTNMIGSVVNALGVVFNDAYRATEFKNTFADKSEFVVDELYAHKTLVSDKFYSIKNDNDSKLLIDIVDFVSESSFENYSYEIVVDEGVVKSLKLRSLVTTDSGSAAINMYEAKFDFVSKKLDLLYAKPIKNPGIDAEDYLDVFFTTDDISSVMWGQLFTATIDNEKSVETCVETERYSGELSESLKTEILDFGYEGFYQNLINLAAVSNSDFVEIEDKFTGLKTTSHVSFDFDQNKFVVAE